jgi:hypothetical protein
MSAKTTVAIDIGLRKTIKKLAVWLDISQGEVIKRAIKAYEKSMINAGKDGSENDEAEKDAYVQKVLDETSERVLSADPEMRETHQLLQEGSETIDDFIIRQWRTGLEDEE